MSKSSPGEAQFLLFIRSTDWPGDFPIPEHEYKFSDLRDWRFDFAWPEYLLALEIQGGAHTPGGHARAGETWKEYEKFNFAQLIGWRVLQVTPAMIASKEIINHIRFGLLKTPIKF